MVLRKGVAIYKYKFLWIGLIAVLLGFLAGMTWGIFYSSPIPQQTSCQTNPDPCPLENNQTGTLYGLPPENLEKKINSCDQSGVMTTLIVTHDLPSGYGQFGTDTVSFVRVDFSEKTIRVISIPSNLWMRTPVLSFQNTEYSRLGLVYSFMEKATAGPFQQTGIVGVMAIAQTFIDNFMPIPDHFIVIDLSSAAHVIDEIGGIEVDIPQAMTISGYSFKPGKQQLDGRLVLAYTRYLAEEELGNDWDRLKRRDLVLSALQVRLQIPANFVKIPYLLEKYKEYYVTDLTPELISSLVCMLIEMPNENIEYLKITPDMLMGPGPDTSMIPDVLSIRDFLQKQLTP